MMGTRTPCLSSSSTMRGTAAAASSLLTVTRTSSDPARARAAHCWAVEGTSAVSVLVIDCTTTGASDPTRTPPTTTVTVFLRGIIAMGSLILTRGKRDLASGIVKGERLSLWSGRNLNASKVSLSRPGYRGPPSESQLHPKLDLPGAGGEVRLLHLGGRPAEGAGI